MNDRVSDNVEGGILMEIILLCLYGKVTVIVIFLIIYLYWIWKKVRLIKWEQAPGDTRDWIRNQRKKY